MVKIPADYACPALTRELFRGRISDEALAAIRDTTRTGSALGGEDFKQVIEELTGQRVSAGKRGPKAKPLAFLL